MGIIFKGSIKQHTDFSFWANLWFAENKFQSDMGILTTALAAVGFESHNQTFCRMLKETLAQNMVVGVDLLPW